MTHFQGWIEDQIYCGHDGARRFMHDWAGTWEDYEVGIKQYVESGDRVLSLSWQRGAGAGSHVPVELDLAQIATVRGGLIVRFEVWSDCGAAMQSLTATQ